MSPLTPQSAPFPLTLQRLNEQVVAVLSASGEHVGNLKLIGSAWKFKALGYDHNGDVIPGGGPLTQQHNTQFAALDTTLVNAGLMPD